METFGMVFLINLILVRISVTIASGMFNSAESTNREGLNYASLTKSTDFSWTLDNLIYYNRTIGKHDFGFTFLQTATKYEYEANNMSGEGIPLESSLWNAFKSLSSIKKLGILTD